MLKVDFFRLSTAIVVIFAALFVSACGKNRASLPPVPSSAIDTSDYKSYSRDRLALRHPPHWTLEYDDAPDLFADRGVSFKVSEASYVDVLIFEEREISLADIADYVERSLNLTSADYIRDYQRKSMQLGSYPGIVLSWRNMLFVEYKAEVSIFQTEISPAKVFTVFNLDEKTFVEDAANRIPFIKSIEIQ